MHIQNHSKVVFIGDSITFCGRGLPVGEGFAGLGNGYVSMINSLLGAFAPEHGIRIVNMGVGGNTIRHLKERWDRDVLALDPDYVSVMIGVNDVWRHYDHPYIAEYKVQHREYQDTYRHLVEKTLPKTKGMILITPFFMEANRQDTMRMHIDAYADIVRSIAKQYGLLLVDMQLAFDDMMSKIYPLYLSKDRIHPGEIGHMFIAKTFLEAAGFSFGRFSMEKEDISC